MTRALSMLCRPALALALLLSLCAPALADSYDLVNVSGSPLKIQSKAIQPKPPHGVNPAFYELAAGQNKSVNFGDDFRMVILHIYNASNMSENFYYNATPEALNGPNKAWKVTVNPGIKVDMVEKP